jgi:PAS domain S-box-containing protein
MQPVRKILIIDDDLEIWNAYQRVLKHSDPTGTSAAGKMESLVTRTHSPHNQHPEFKLFFASQGQEGFSMVQKALAENEPFQTTFIDIRMPPGWDGMRTACHIRKIDPNIEIVIVTAYTDRSREEIVKEVGTPEKLLFLRKPFDPEELFQLALSLSEKWLLGKRETIARNELAASEARFRSLVEATSDFVWEMDISGRFTYCSPLCFELYGYQPNALCGNIFYEILLPEDDIQHHIAMLEQAVANFTKLNGGDRRCLKQDGTEIFIESNGVPIINDHGDIIGFRGIDRDISERVRIQDEKRRLEEQYQQAQKMEAIGTLAGGIAHDLNNVLTPIVGYAELCLLLIGSDHPLSDDLKMIEKSAQKAAALIRQILTFSRKQILSPVVCDLNALIKDFYSMLRRLIREDIRLDLELSESVWPILTDTSQFEQILINLLVNARDAIAGSGRIVIRSANCHIPADKEFLDVENFSFHGDYVLLSIIDTGSGIEQGIVEKIFDPFFTTKGIGQGTGLGLATVYGVTKQQNGHIQVLSHPGEGTTFTIYLPRTDILTSKNNIEEFQQIVGGTETVLLAEDDPTVRSLATAVLKTFGYTVITAVNGLEAEMKFRAAEKKVHLVITDVLMPDMGGNELIHIIRNEKPHIPAIFISGYPRDLTSEKLLDSAHTDFLQKPFKPQLLAKKVRELLDQLQK